LSYWKQFSEKGQHDNDKTIRLLEQELVDMEASFTEISSTTLIHLFIRLTWLTNDRLLHSLQLILKPSYWEAWSIASSMFVDLIWLFCVLFCADHLQMTLSKEKAEIERTTSEILGQQKYLATEVTFRVCSRFPHCFALRFIHQLSSWLFIYVFMIVWRCPYKCLYESTTLAHLKWLLCTLLDYHICVFYRAQNANLNEDISICCQGQKYSLKTQVSCNMLYMDIS